MRASIALGVMAAAAAAAGLHGQQQFVLSSQDRARLIAIDFAAVTATGQPVSDLQADEVQLKIDGRARVIRALEYVPVQRIGGAGAEVPYGSNVTPNHGRTLILVVDFETLRPGREASLREHVNRLVRGLGPADRVALLTLPYGGVKVDLTTDHSRITRALSVLSGQGAATEGESDAACRTRTTLVALAGALRDLATDEAPATIVFFSGQLAGPSTVQIIQSGVTIGRCQLLRDHFQQVGAAVAKARAQFYVIQHELNVSSTGLAGLEHLTGVTGAPLLQLGDAADGALGRVVRESGGYYIARVEPEPQEENGTIRGLSVDVKRAQVVVRARPQVMVMRPLTRRVDNAPATPLAMMREARVFRDLPLRITGYASREPGARDVRVVALFDSPDPSAAMNDAIVGLFSEDGKLVASQVLGASELQGRSTLTALVVPPGTYRLRVAAVEASGRGGTADYQVDAALLPAGPLKMSDLVLGLSRDGQFRPRLEFGDEASVMAHLELYGGQRGNKVGVVVEIARSLNGPAILAMPGVFTATTEADKFLVTATVPLGALPAGDYVVRATVAAEGQAGGRVVRPIRKVRR